MVISFAGVLQILHQTLAHTLRNVFCIVVWFIARSYFFYFVFRDACKKWRHKRRGCKLYENTLADECVNARATLYDRDTRLIMNEKIM